MNYNIMFLLFAHLSSFGGSAYFPLRFFYEAVKVRVLFIPTYLAGITIGVVLGLLLVLGILKVKGWWRNFPHFVRSVLVVSNHEYFGEQWLTAGLFFWQYLFRPFLWGPWTLAAKENYLDRYPWIMGRVISVVRKNGNGERRSFRLAGEALARGESVIFFPEGGRTTNGLDFRYSDTSECIRIPWKEGFAALARNPGVTVVPIWWQKRGWRMKLIVGEPMIFDHRTPRDEITEKVQVAVLGLADTANQINH